MLYLSNFFFLNMSSTGKTWRAITNIHTYATFNFNRFCQNGSAAYPTELQGANLLLLGMFSPLDF